MIAHVSGLPLEEALLAAASASTAGGLVARNWLMTQARRLRRSRRSSGL